MKKVFRKSVSILLSILIILSCMSCLLSVSVSAATYRNGAQSGPSTSYKNGRYYSNYTKVPITGDNRTDLLAIALSQLGYQEGAANGYFSGEVSGSANYVEFSYNMGDLGLGYGGSDYPWCASFVSWCLYQSRCTDQGTYKSLGRYHSGDYTYIWKEISCSQWVRQLKGAGYFKYSAYEGGTYTPKYGDLVYFQNSGGVAHIGMCLYTSGGRIYTVEGNTSDSSGLEANGGGVYFKNYSLSSSYLYGYGVLPYKSDSSVAKIDYSGANPTPGLYVANAAKYVYSTSTATSYSYVLPRFSMFEVDEICSNGRLGGTFTINGSTVKGYVTNNSDRVIQLSSSGEAVDPTADERATLNTLINQAKAARHFNYSESAIETLRTAYANAVAGVANTSATESELQGYVTALQTALNNTGSNTIAIDNEGVFINGINKSVTAGDCIMFSSAHNGDGVITVDNANIRYTVNVVIKWDATQCLNTVKSVTVGTGNDTPSITLASDEYLLAAHDWETGVASGDNPVEYSGTNYRLLSNLEVGTPVILSGATVFDTSGVKPCAYAKFLKPNAPKMNSRNEYVDAGDFTLFTPDFNSGLITHANANIHNTLNVLGKWDDENQAWVVTDKYVGTGAADETSNIEIVDGQILIAGLAIEGDVANEANYNKLNNADVGEKIIFTGISPTSSTNISIASCVDFVDINADSGEEDDGTTGPVNLALNKTYQVATTSTAHVASLTDGQAATDISTDGTWFGFMNTGGGESSNTDANGMGTVVLDLGTKYNLEDVQMHIYAGENLASIAPPTYVNVYVSSNGTDFDQVGTLGLDSSATAAYWAELEDIAMTGRYVKFEVGPSGNSTWVFVNEIEVYGTSLTGSENIALYSHYEASGVESSTYTANLTDGVYGTEITDEWFGYTTDTTLEDCNTEEGVGTAIIDLGARYNVSQVKAHLFAGENEVGAGAPDSVTVSVSTDGSTYVKAGTLTLDAEATAPYWATLAEANAVGRYVKLEFACTSDWTLVNEIEVYGTEFVQSNTNNIALGASYIAPYVTGEPYTADLTDGINSQIFQYGVNNSSWYGIIDTGDSTTGNASNGRGIVTIDLGGQSEITGAGIHVFAGDNDLGALQPNYINVYISDDGESYSYIKTLDYNYGATAPFWNTFTNPEPVYARYVKFAFGVTSNTWALINEIQVYGTRLTSDEALEPDTTSLVALSGSFNDWNATPNMKTVDENTVTTTLELEAGTYEFKILSGNAWYGNSGTIQDTTASTSSTGWVMDSGAGNCTLEATGGKYIFTFNRSTNTLYVFHGEYSLVGFINGNNVGCDTDVMNPGYEFVDGKVTVDIDRNSYVFVKYLDNTDFFMFDEYCTETSGTLKSTSTGASEKMFVPAGKVTFTMVANADGTVNLSYEIAEVTEPTTEAPTEPAPKEYSIVGFINGSNFGSQGDESNPGYAFVDGKVTVTFDRDSYIFVKTTDNSIWYMFDAYCTDTTGTLSIADEDTKESMLVPAGEIEFTLVENEDGTLTLSYRDINEEIAPDTVYSLVGYINGANADCEEDFSNSPNQFTDTITLNITESSYVYLKTADNENIYMANGWQGSNTSATLYNTADGIKLPNKLNVPVGEVTFTVVENEDGTLTLSYTVKVPTVFSLIGYINGANVGCEQNFDDSPNQFTETITLNFTEDSYVYLKTADNENIFMTKGWQGDNTSATFYNTATGVPSPSKLFVPKGEVTFTVVENEDGTVTLSYDVKDEFIIKVAVPKYKARYSWHQWKEVDLYYSTSYGGSYKDAVKIPMTPTGETVTVNDVGTTTFLTTGECAVFEVKLTGEQVKAIEKAPHVGFIRHNQTHRTYRTATFNILKAPIDEFSAYSVKKKSISELEGKTFVIGDCMESGTQELRSYIGYWVSPTEK